MDTVIETHELTKKYGKKNACLGISISVPAGSLFGFLGPNGAGKSTFIKMLNGLLQPTSGSATVLGKPIDNISARKKIGYLPELFKFQEWMTGWDLLRFHCSLYKLDNTAERSNRVLKLVGMTGNEKQKVGSYSKGMQQRIGLACALLPDPDLLFLDEPTSALDPIGRREVREICLELKRLGKTLFLNSHLLSEVEQLCDTVTIINQGKVIRTSAMEDLLAERITLNIIAGNVSETVVSELRQIDSDVQVTAENDAFHIRMRLPTHDDVPKTAALLISNSAKLYELMPQKDSLEDVFIRLVTPEKE